MTSRAARAGVAAIAIALLGAACGDTSVQTVGSESPPVSAGGNEITPPPMDPRGDTGSAGPDCSGRLISVTAAIPRGIGEFVQQSHAAVVGRVLSLSEPKWNSIDEQPWCDREKDGRLKPDAHGGPAVQYREAVVEVEDVLYDSPPVPVTAGAHLTVRLVGNGTDTGPVIGPLGRNNASAGPVEVGARVLWVLREETFYRHPVGAEKAVTLHVGAFGNWRVVGDRAENKIPERAAPFAQLRARLVEARHNPATFPRESSRGAVNPVE